MNIEALVRENIRKLKPYSSARSEYSGTASVFLDANENPYDLHGSTLNRYPDPQQSAIKSQVAELKNVPPESIFLGNGSDEAIDFVSKLLRYDHQERLSAKEAMGHQYFAPIREAAAREGISARAGFAART